MCRFHFHECVGENGLTIVDRSPNKFKSAKQCWPLILVKAEVGHATVSAVVVDLVPTWSLDLDQDTELYLG